MQYRVNGSAAYAAEPIVKHAKKSNVRPRPKKRRKTVSMNAAFVMFLAFVSALTVAMCVNYLKQKEVITRQAAVNESLESKLQKLRSENDALLDNVNMGIDWNHIKEKAISELGMKYAEEDQIVWYNTVDSGYVRQYRDVPS